MADDETEELQAEQRRRARHEADEARAAGDPDEAAAHERRADKAAYLEEKLAERAASEHESP